MNVFLCDKITPTQEGVGVECSDPVMRKKQAGNTKELWCGIPLFPQGCEK